MCWKCSLDKFKLQRAQEDIITYKVLRLKKDKLYSPNFNYFPWLKGETYISILNIGTCKIPTSYRMVGEQGLHSYKQTPGYDPTLKAFRFCRFLTSDKSIPTYYQLSKGMYVVKCIIPKGAMYAINDYNEVISEQLRFEQIGTLLDNEVVFDTDAENIITDVLDLNIK